VSIVGKVFGAVSN